MSVTAHDVLVLIQVRTGSSRLPGKVLMPLGSSTVLDQMWTRLTQAQIPAKFAMITTVDPSDEPIREYCSQKNILCYSGSVNDLLDRHYQAWKLWGGKYVVKIPSDCPLIDPKVMEQVVGYFFGIGQFRLRKQPPPSEFP
jgi:spore coat polysaccharide biosynthesis protein SpsF